MKDFESGVTYLRKESLKYGLIQESDNDEVLVERLARIVRGQDPFDGNAEEAERAENIRREAEDAQITDLLEKADESGSDQKSE